MGCGGGKEKFEDDVAPRVDVQVKPAKPKGPPTPLATIYETWPAGRIAQETAPHYIPRRCGPYTRLQKVPPDAEHAGAFLLSTRCVPPRVVAPRDNDDDDDDRDSSFCDAVDAGSSLFARAFLPSALTGFCVGIAKPDLAIDAMVPGFDYHHAVDGRADFDLITAGGVIEDVANRRRLLLFPKGCDALALFVRLDTADAKPRSAPLVLPYNGTADASRVDPVDDAFITFSLLRQRGAGTASSTRSSTPIVTPLQDASFSPAPPVTDEVSFTRSECSAGFTLWNWSHGATAPNVAFGALLTDLPDGEHRLHLSLAFRHSASSFSAVYVKPAATSGAAPESIVGQYTHDAESPTTVLSDVVAKASVTITVNDEARAVIRDCLAAPPAGFVGGDGVTSHNASLRDDPRGGAHVIAAPVS